MNPNPADRNPKTPPAAGFCQVIACLLLIPAVLGAVVAAAGQLGSTGLLLFFVQCGGLVALSAIFFALGRIVISASETAHHSRESHRALILMTEEVQKR